MDRLLDACAERGDVGQGEDGADDRLVAVRVRRDAHEEPRPAAIPHFAEARRLEPGNWTYKRQAWSFADPLQVETGPYEGDWLTDIRELGPESYYAPLDMPRD